MLGLPLGLVVICALALAVSFAFRSIVAMWSGDEYSYAWLIIPLAVLLLIHRYPATPQGGRRWPGLGLAAFSLVLMLAGWAAQNVSLSIYAWILGISSLVWTSLGSRGIRRLFAPLAFLVFMIPLPLAFYITLSAQMQLISSKLGVALMAILGTQVSLDGNMIDLANGRLEVAQACNGLRYLFPLLSIGFLFAVMMDDRVWKKGLLVISAIPIAVVMNSVRLALTGLLVDRWGIGFAQGLPHEAAGLLCFAVCVGALALNVFLLGRCGPGRPTMALDALLPRFANLRAISRWPSPKPFVVCAILLLTSAIAITALPARATVIPERRPLALYPMALGDWLGQPTTLDPATLGALGLTDYVLADFVDRGDASNRINFYIAYYASQRFGVQVHSPRLCIPGEGWSVADESLVSIGLANGSVISANRSVIERRGARQIVYYWFDERGRSLVNEWQVKFAAITDSLLSARSDGALVRMVTPVADGDDSAADRRLQRFASIASASLRRYVPE